MNNAKELVKRSKSSLARARDFNDMKTKDISNYFEMFSDQIASALPKHLTGDRMIQMATTLVSKNEKLKSCTTKSIVGAVMQASILGFQPVDALGECYIIPYGKEAQFQIGYKGYLSLLWRSGQAETIFSGIIYRDEIRGKDWEHRIGKDADFWHIPRYDIDKSVDNIALVYAGATLKAGGFYVAVLEKENVEKLRLRNPMQKGTPTGAWKTDYEAMSKAKAFKQLIKFLPISTEYREITATDEKVINTESFDKGRLKLEEIEEVDYEEANFDDDEKEVLFDANTGEVKDDKKD